MWALLEMVDGFGLWQSNDPPHGFAQSRWVEDLRFPGYGVTAKRSRPTDRDLAYNAVQQAISAMTGLAARLEDDSSTIYLPVVVTKSRLFDAFLDDNGEVTVREVQRRSILVRHPLAHVMIVSEAGLDTMVDDLGDLASALLEGDA